jgi:hypothetical protein
MENKQGTSFIPKSPVRGAVKPKGVRKIYIFTYVAFVFFFGTMLATAGTFFYNISIESQLISAKERLSQERNQFNQSDLERVRELEKRMNTAFSILDTKVSLYKLFTTLEETTLRPAKISGFEYKKTVDNSLDLALTVDTSDFNTALFQREIFSSNSILKGSEISEISYTDGLNASVEDAPVKSNVSFIVSKKLTSSDIPYTASSNTGTGFQSFSGQDLVETPVTATDEPEEQITEPETSDVTGQ